MTYDSKHTEILSPEEWYNITKDEYHELTTFIYENSSIFINGVIENKSATDGGSSHMKIELADGKAYEIGGANISNDKYGLVYGKILDTVGRDRFSDYKNNIIKNAE